MGNPVKAIAAYAGRGDLGRYRQSPGSLGQVVVKASVEACDVDGPGQSALLTYDGDAHTVTGGQLTLVPRTGDTGTDETEMTSA